MKCTFSDLFTLVLKTFQIDVEIDQLYLHGEVLPVGGHVEQVGHEGDLGDGGPESPGQEVIHRAAIALHAGEGDPAEADPPGGLVEIPEGGDVCGVGRDAVGTVDQGESQQGEA